MTSRKKPQHAVRKVGLYGRVSTTRQAVMVDGGLDTQFSLMERHVALWNDSKPEAWVVVDRYREEGYSGKNLDRPEFKRLMADVEAGRVDTVVVHKIDRITRSLRDFYDLWEEFEQHGVHFVSLHESFDTTSAVGRAMLKLILVFAELEREQTGERTAATLKHRAQRGLWGSGRPPLGYRRDEAEKGLLVVHARRRLGSCARASSSGSSSWGRRGRSCGTWPPAATARRRSRTAAGSARAATATT